MAAIDLSIFSSIGVLHYIYLKGRVMLPLNLRTDDGPIFVNAKQYHGIIRRRKSRAMAELKHKLSKNRKGNTANNYFRADGQNSGNFLTLFYSCLLSETSGV